MFGTRKKKIIVCPNCDAENTIFIICRNWIVNTMAFEINLYQLENNGVIKKGKKARRIHKDDGSVSLECSACKKIFKKEETENLRKSIREV